MTGMTRVFLPARVSSTWIAVTERLRTRRLRTERQPSKQWFRGPSAQPNDPESETRKRVIRGRGSYSVPRDEQKAISVTDAEFDRIVGEALDSLPDWVNDTMDNIVFAVADRPSPEQAADGDDLLGLYEGVSLLDRGNTYSAVLPDTITIFKQPHLALGLDPDELRNEIRITVLHEIAHHLGMDEERLHELGWD